MQDVFATALERWPREGTPDNPGAWVVAAARNRAIDRIRREQTFTRKAELLARLNENVSSTSDTNTPAPPVPGRIPPPAVVTGPAEWIDFRTECMASTLNRLVGRRRAPPPTH